MIFAKPLAIYITNLLIGERISKNRYQENEMKSENELRRLGVCILDKDRLWFQCMECKQKWSPNLLEHGRLPKGYWKCPNGCNNE